VPFERAGRPSVNAGGVTTDGYRFSRHNRVPTLMQMPVPSVPTKTPLGQDELRNRTQRLGQRHRTVLFLVDGRRTLAEVLSLAHQAGAQTVHFEDLVRLGLVEMPAEVDEAAEEAVDSGSGALDALRLTSVALDVPEPLVPVASIVPLALDEHAVAAPVDSSRVSSTSLLPPQVAATPWLHSPIDEPIALEAVPVPARRRAVEAPAAPVQLVDATPWVDTIPAGTPAVAVAAPKALKKASPRQAGRAAASAPVVMTTMLGRALGRGRGRQQVPLPPVATPMARPSSEQDLIVQVRELLLDTMRIDAPLFAALTLTRVRSAQTQRELIGIVWEIERHRSHARMTRDELISLQQARELLGMGNTVVAGDSQSDRHDDWPTTQPPL